MSDIDQVKERVWPSVTPADHRDTRPVVVNHGFRYTLKQWFNGTKIWLAFFVVATAVYVAHLVEHARVERIADVDERDDARTTLERRMLYTWLGVSGVFLLGFLWVVVFTRRVEQTLDRQ